MKRATHYLTIIAVFICVGILYPKNPPEPPVPDPWEGVMIETTEGFPKLSKFAEVARKHLTKADPGFQDIVERSAVITYDKEGEVTICFHQGLGKLTWYVCLNRKAEVIAFTRRLAIDAVGNPSIKPPRKSMCE